LQKLNSELNQSLSREEGDPSFSNGADDSVIELGHDFQTNRRLLSNYLYKLDYKNDENFEFENLKKGYFKQLTKKGIAIHEAPPV
jgi:hypothetical protein